MSSTYEMVTALTNTGAGIAPRLLTVFGWLMSVRSRTRNELLPRSVTRARLRRGVGVGRGEGVAEEVAEAEAEEEAEGEGAFPTGVGELHAEAISAVTASARIHATVFMSLQQ
ncbi:MAG TPA: hypothetical protein VNU19_07915 [Candidatus Acidoferrum sp.]|nr:hypothetical protein [Candidatus Acidoferrum sp.]